MHEKNAGAVCGVYCVVFHLGRFYAETYSQTTMHEDVIKWKHFPRYWPFVRGIHPVTGEFPAVTRSFDVFIDLLRINRWVNNGEAGDLRHLLAHYDIIVMVCLVSVGVTVNCWSMCSISPCPSGLLHRQWGIVWFLQCQWSDLEGYGSTDRYRSNMMTSSNGNIFHVTGPLWGKSTDHRWIPLTKVNGMQIWCFFDLRLNKRLSKQSRRRWFETPWHPLWRICTEYKHDQPCA